MSFLDNLNPPAVKGDDLPGLCKKPVGSINIKSITDISDAYDVFLFSTIDTLSRNNQTLPSAAVLIPQLRRMGKQVAMFTTDQDIDRDELIKKINYLGLSFS